MVTTKRQAGTALTLQEAAQLEGAIRKLGDYSHVVVRAERGHLLVVPDGEAVARLTPLGGGQYSLSFRNHTGKWEPMPFAGDLSQQAGNITTALAPYLERWDLSGRTGGSDHWVNRQWIRDRL